MPLDAYALIILWSAREPERVGEVALLPRQAPPWVLGRALDSVATPTKLAEEDVEASGEDVFFDGGPGTPVRFCAQRPEADADAERPQSAPRRVRGESISRRQLEISETPEGLLVRNVGRCRLAVNGQLTTGAVLHPGDTLYLQSQLLLYCTRRPLQLLGLRSYPTHRLGAFGGADADGFIGESPAMWVLRETLASCARSNFHVLIIGESGTGKELAARAVHNLSQRAGKRLVADNIAAIPPSIAAALLFGNKKNFPNPGMEEHLGLIGAAHGSTLFLDEIGDMPEEVQPMFLRVADRGGEYFRLGEKLSPQRSDFRLVGATNRPEKMRHELKRRFERQIRVPDLNERREDIPLLVQHLLRQQAQQNDSEILRFFDAESGRWGVHPLLVEQLVHHCYATHVSELGFLLGQAMSDSNGKVIRPLKNRAGSRTAENRAPTKKGGAAPLPTPEQAQRALDEMGGRVTQAAATLGISRDQLNRMIYREGLILRRQKPRLHGGTENLT